MNNALVEQVHLTTPATDPANLAQTPAPPPPLRPVLVVLRGARIAVEFPLYAGRNVVGRFSDKPVDIDLTAQETVDQIWCSRNHAAFVAEGASVYVEDLNSLNGTWVNGQKVLPGQPRALKPGDVVQIGTVQLKFTVR
jgi:pSer/pThr/pTyr-binding forkhead associated (FHA) protein